MALSLADELSEIEDDASTSAESASTHTETRNKPISHQLKQRQHLNENTPLAKYLTRIQNRGENAQDEEEEEKVQHINGEEENVNGHAEVSQTTGATATSSSSSSSALKTLALVLLEFISPLFASLLFPESTLSTRARTWNVTVCRIEVERQQRTNQQHNATVTREYIQKQMRYLAQIFRMVLVFIVLEIVVFARLILSAWLSSSTSFLPLSITTLLFLHSLFNLLLTLHSNNSSFHYHSFSYSLLTYFQLASRSEAETKKLIMNLIEVELVKRGYYLNSSKKHDATMINVPIVIQKMEGGARNMRQDESRNTLLRHELKSILEKEIFLMKQVMSEIQTRKLAKDAGLDGGASLQASSSFASSPSSSASSPASSFSSSSSSSSSSPSIVELKSMRTQWLNQRARLIHSTMELLEKVMSDGAESSLASIFMSYLSSSSSSSPQHSTIESSLSHAYLRLNMLLSQNHERLRDFLPEPLESASTTSSSSFSSSASSPPAHRASLQTSLLNLRDSIRSIERRIELAMERGVSMKRSDDEAGLKATTNSESSQMSSVHDLLSILSFPPLPSFTDFSSSSSSHPPSSPSSNINPWSSTLSTSLTSDLTYFRTIYRQFQTQCERLERDILVCDKVEGVERNDGDSEKVMEALEPSVVNETESSSSPNADASVTPADLIAAMRAMRKKTPDGMGALFEGDGQFEEREFQPRRSAVKSSSSSAAPAAPAVSIFTILAELKSVLQQRKPAYEYVSQAQAETESKEAS